MRQAAMALALAVCAAGCGGDPTPLATATADLDGTSVEVECWHETMPHIFTIRLNGIRYASAPAFAGTGDDQYFVAPGQGAFGYAAPMDDVRRAGDDLMASGFHRTGREACIDAFAE